MPGVESVFPLKSLRWSLFAAMSVEYFCFRHRHTFSPLYSTSSVWSSTLVTNTQPQSSVHIPAPDNWLSHSSHICVVVAIGSLPNSLRSPKIFFPPKHIQTSTAPVIWGFPSAVHSIILNQPLEHINLAGHARTEQKNCTSFRLWGQFVMRIVSCGLYLINYIVGLHF